MSKFTDGITNACDTLRWDLDLTDGEVNLVSNILLDLFKVMQEAREKKCNIEVKLGYKFHGEKSQ